MNLNLPRINGLFTVVVLRRYGYSPYGESTIKSGSSDGNANTCAAREDDQTGLLFYRARLFDPVLKRFVSEDPIGLKGGANTFMYVLGTPARSRDPLGLIQCPWDVDADSKLTI